MKKIDKWIPYIKESGLPVFIVGGGEMAHVTQASLAARGITEARYVVDDGTADETDQQVLSKEYLLEKYERYILIRGYLNLLYLPDDEIHRRWPGCVKVFTVSDMYDPFFTEDMTGEFCNAKKSQFTEVYNCLQDELSRESLRAFLLAKIEGDHEYIIPYVVHPQYFFEDAPWKCDKDDVLLDGGAYTGDSIEDFIIWNKGSYAGIIACEPDKKNYECLYRNIKEGGIKNIRVVKKGLYKETGVLRFVPSQGTMSWISSDGNDEVEVDTIDNISDGEKISIIKMDIEGSEMDALIGAKQVLQNWRPILMISAYHKRDDIYHIFQFVNETVENYRFYFRCHKPLAIDAVLYAIPEERLI